MSVGTTENNIDDVNAETQTKEATPNKGDVLVKDDIINYASSDDADIQYRSDHDLDGNDVDGNNDVIVIKHNKANDTNLQVTQTTNEIEDEKYVDSHDVNTSNMNVKTVEEKKVVTMEQGLC